MRITSLSEYGVICALHLAKRSPDGPVSGREIASQEQLPPDYVEQVLLRLRRAGLVTSTRGAHGGYHLSRPAAEISVRDIVQASEEVVFELNCESHPVGTARCSSSHSCSIRPVWMMLQQKIDDVLAGVSLADLIGMESDVQRRIGFSAIESVPNALPASRTLRVLTS